ncbi:MAG: helix-hairpin-helix domain-containing protein [Alphaproteobacteria bacterium]|nr:helix-hairpin-helix domain-containing protein [Alphaproteobacteria bacterium]
MGALTEIKGIGPVLAKACADKGYRTVKKVAAAVAADLATVPGISEARAKILIAAAQTLLADALPPKTVAAAKTESGVKKKRTKKPTPEKKNAKARKAKKGKKNKDVKKTEKNEKKKTSGKPKKETGKKSGKKSGKKK